MLNRHFLGLLTAVLVVSSATGQTIEWSNPAGGDWSDPANWTPMDVPDSPGETASISLAGSYDITVSSSVLALGSLVISNPDARVLILPDQILAIEGSAINDGQILVNPDSINARTKLQFNQPGASITGTGSVRLSANSYRSELLILPGADLTNGASHTVSGYGRINGELHNDGTIRSEGFVLRFIPGTIYNNGKIESGTSPLDLTGMHVINTDSGEISIDDNARLFGCRVDGGRITEPTPFSTLLYTSIDDNTQFWNVEFDVERIGVDRSGPSIHLYESVVMNCRVISTTSGGDAGIHLHGIDEIGGPGEWFGACVYPEGNLTIVGPGIWRETTVFSNPDAVITFGPEFAQSDARFIGGIFEINRPFTGLVLGNATVTNNSVLEDCRLGGIVTNNGIIDGGSAGYITYNQNGEFFLARFLSGFRHIIGGTVHALEPNTYISSTTGVNAEGELDSVRLVGTFLQSGYSSIRIRSHLELTGTIIVNANETYAPTNFFVAGDMLFDGEGTIDLNDGWLRAAILPDQPGDTLTQGIDNTIKGRGFIGVPLLNHGTISPKGPVYPMIPDFPNNGGPQPGTMQAGAPVTCTATSQFVIDVFDFNEADCFDSTDTLHIDGRFEIRFEPGYAPTGSWSFRPIVATGGITGEFDEVLFTGATFDTSNIEVRYSPTDVTIGVFCDADLAAPFGSLNFFDLAAFIALFNAGEPAADLAAPFGTLNFFDISAYIAAYNAGCP